MSLADLRDLFDYLDENLDEGCDSTLWHTRAFLELRKLNETKVLPWLVEQGGGCDCEVLANVEEKFQL